MEVKQNPTILIMDDDLDFIDLMKILLKEVSIDVRAYSELKPFIQDASTLNFNLCLIDLNFDSRSDMGHHVIKFLKEKYGPDINIMMVSASSKAEDIQKAKDCGANDYLQKPVDKDILYTKISRYFDLPELEEYSPYKGRVPGTLKEIKILTELELSRITETGFVFRSGIFINTGTLLKIKSELLNNIGLNPNTLFNITKTEMISDEWYECTINFDETNIELMNSVRKWIFCNKYLKKKPAPEEAGPK